MADVLLTHSYHLYFDRKQMRKMQPYPPLGTFYAAALLRSAGISVAVFDSMLNNPETGFRQLLTSIARRSSPFTKTTSTSCQKCASLACAKQRTTYSKPRGVQARWYWPTGRMRLIMLPISCSADSAASCLARRNGRCWSWCSSFCRTVTRTFHTSPASPICTRKRASTMRTPSRPLMRDVNVMPGQRGSDRHSAIWRGVEVCPRFLSLNLVSSRGCPYRCNWCAKPIYGDQFSVRSPASVAEEMRRLKYEHGAEHLWFADDIFGLKPKWVYEFASEVELRRAAVPFKMQSRVDLMSAETVQALHRAGCIEVWMGVESGSQKILTAMDKGTRVDQVAVARESLRKEGIRACYFLQFGYPGENWQDIQKTIALVRDTRPDDIGVSVAYPLPGTRFFDRVRAQLGKKTNWSDSEDLSMMFQGSYTDEFYRALHDALHAQVDTWHSGHNAGVAVKENHDHSAPRLDDLWERVVYLEKICRNSQPTVLDSFPSDSLVQLRLAPEFVHISSSEPPSGSD